MERRLAAILCADVYGYSRLMGEDEEATLRTLTSHRKLIDSQIEKQMVEAESRVLNQSVLNPTYLIPSSVS